MARILVVGGGFAGVVAAESLAKKLGPEHDITLVSRDRRFLFYPALVRLAFGQCDTDDIAFDLREAMLDRRVRFVRGEVARIYPSERLITFAHGDLVGEMPYDYLLVSVGRRLATERVPGFFENAHHLLDVDDAKKFGAAVQEFHRGRAVVGHCPDARLPIPIFETAFALSDSLREKGVRDQCQITVASSEDLDAMFGGISISKDLTAALQSHGIELVTDFRISKVKPDAVIGEDGRSLDCDLNMIVPPFSGPGVFVGTPITDAERYARVDSTMRVQDVERIYAAGDCVSFGGPKLGHIAVRQGEVAAENLASEVQGLPLSAHYNHEMMLVIEASGIDSIFVHKKFWTDDDPNIKHGRFWAWARHMQEKYWKAKHN
jgi:sulfide:quinone oxidoreductase